MQAIFVRCVKNFQITLAVVKIWHSYSAGGIEEGYGLSMKLRKKLGFILLFMVVCVALAWLVFNLTASGCRSRDTIEAVAPVYPGSVLIQQETVFDSDIGAGRSYTYTVNTSPKAVSKFYAETTGVEFDEKWFDDSEVKTQLYFGVGIPFGTYTDGINKEARPTTYFLDIHWDRCGPIHKSVE